MKYVPNLIPREHRVLPDYFKQSPKPDVPGASPYQLLEYVGAGIFFLVGLSALPHLVMFLLSCLIGFILLPYGQSLLEKWLSFRMTGKIKLGACLMLCLIQTPFYAHYHKLDMEAQQIAQAEKERQYLLKKEEERKEMARRDSLVLYLGLADTFENESKYDSALLSLDRADFFANQGETGSRKDAVVSKLARKLIEEKRYADAISALIPPLFRNPDNRDLLYDRAVCYAKTGDKAAAVTDAKRAIELGHAEAQALYDQINPIKKRVAYYQTMCCDGTPSPSNAKGRGACSHHGGVCNWNEPVYEEYREYE